MGGHRRDVEDLDRRLARHRRHEARTAVALLELERDPWYLLLDAGGGRGRTAHRWAGVRPTRDRLWRDYSRHVDVLRSAERVRSRRRRPVDADVVELRGLLADADTRTDRIRVALDDVRAVVAACAATSDAVLVSVAPVEERLAAARRNFAGLGLGADDPDVVDAAELTARVAALRHDVATDPLAFAGPSTEVPALVTRLGALHLRLGELTRLRGRWDDVPAALDRDLDALAAHRRRVGAADARARAALRDTVPALPPDRSDELRSLRDAATTATGWRERHDAVVALGARTAAARVELDRAGALVAELIDRRDDLRGRFGAYRARTRRLGCTDDAELTELAGRIGTRLWSVPAELARATRDLGAYRRRLRSLGTP